MSRSVFEDLEGWDDFDKIEDACFRIAKDINNCTGTLNKNPVTPSEARCIQAISEGHSHHEAAEVVGVSFYTLQTQIKQAKIKLRAKDKYHLIAQAFREGMIT